MITLGRCATDQREIFSDGADTPQQMDNMEQKNKLQKQQRGTTLDEEEHVL